MAAVTMPGGTAGENRRGDKLTTFSKDLESKGYFVYAKTGTIGNGNTNNQLLAVVITKGQFDGQDKDTFNELTRNHKFYVAYFVTENSYHNYSVIRNALKTIVNSNEFLTYMNQNNE